MCEALGESHSTWKEIKGPQVCESYEQELCATVKNVKFGLHKAKLVLTAMALSALASDTGYKG